MPRQNIEKINRLIADREKWFDRLDKVAEKYGLDPDALDMLDMWSPEALAELADAIKNVGHATQALAWAEEE